MFDPRLQGYVHVVSTSCVYTDCVIENQSMRSTVRCFINLFHYNVSSDPTDNRIPTNDSSA
jgi:hypothetical protein